MYDGDRQRAVINVKPMNLKENMLNEKTKIIN